MTRRVAGAVLGVITCLFACSALAQLWGPGPGMWATGPSYVGPGDVVSGASMWAGLRAYSRATAGTRSANVCNSGDANCADVNTLANGNFDAATAQASPLNCGGSGGTCTIKYLYDKSGANACSSSPCDLFYPTIASRPTLAFNCRNGHACMSFNGSQLLQVVTPSFAVPVTISVFAIIPGPLSGAQRIADWNGTEVDFQITDNAWRITNGGSSVFNTAADGAWHAAQAVFDTSCDLYIDGASSTGSCGTASISSTLKVGVSLIGEIREIGFWNVSFSSGNKSAMNSNQTAY